jgi:hypothetical protein
MKDSDSTLVLIRQRWRRFAGITADMNAIYQVLETIFTRFFVIFSRCVPGWHVSYENL